MSAGSSTRVTLRALEGEPLGAREVRDMVMATAHAIAERQGVEVLGAYAKPDRVVVTLRAGRIEAWGFAAELGRLTSNWYRHKYDRATLWGGTHPNEVREEREDGDGEDGA